MARIRQFRFAVVPTAGQEAVLHRLVDGQCQVYNAALQERRDGYRLAQSRGLVPPTINYVHQCRELTGVLADRGDLASFGTVVSRGTLRRVERAFAAFFARVARGERPGYPRYKSYRRFDSVCYEDRAGWKLDTEQSRLYLQGVGRLKVRLHRPIPPGARLRACVIRRARVWRRNGRPAKARWTVTVAVELADVEPLAPTGRRAGVDVGVRRLATICDDRGQLTHVANPRPYQRAQSRLVRLQRRLAASRPGSNRRGRLVRDLQAAHAKVANSRAWSTHQLSHDLVRDFDLIAIEDLAVAHMCRSPAGTVDAPGTNVAAKAGLNRSILDAGWAQWRQQLTYKAADAGRRVVAINARHSSQQCHHCGHTNAGNRHGPNFCCLSCDHSADADDNAAANILQRAESAQQPPLRNPKSP